MARMDCSSTLMRSRRQTDVSGSDGNILYHSQVRHVFGSLSYLASELRLVCGPDAAVGVVQQSRTVEIQGVHGNKVKAYLHGLGF